MRTNTKSPVIVALDGISFEEALQIAENLKGAVLGFKANDLLDLAGPSRVVKELGRYGAVMADPKLCDIANTVKNRMSVYAEAGAHIVTVHASCGIEAMNAAVKVSEEIYERKGPGSVLSQVAAVTVLTSISEEECNLTFGGPSKAKVLQFARNAIVARVPAIVCSAQELEFLSKFFELNEIAKITPGIVPEWFLKPEDQKRVTTPAMAIEKGATFLVIGRAILKPPKEIGTMNDAANRIQDEVEKALEKMNAIKQRA